MIVPADITAKFPGKFNSLADATIQLYIDEAVLVIIESKWGDWYDLGLLYYTAHLLSIMPVGSSGGSAGAAGPVTSRRVGDVSVSIAAAASADAFSNLSQTSYGIQFATYRRIIQGGPLVVPPKAYSA